jgi:uncharacterized membrane protein YeaQ/YmgE (transglycosylase-associated protein family)
MSAILAVLGTVVGAWIIINLIGALIVGTIAKAILPGKENVSWFMTIVIGFLGGIVGKIIFGLLGWSTGIFMGFIASICGAFILLIIYGMMMANKAKPTKP